MNLNVLITTNLNKLQFHFGRIFQNELSAICCVPVNYSSVLTASPTCRMATFFVETKPLPACSPFDSVDSGPSKCEQRGNDLGHLCPPNR